LAPRFAVLKRPRYDCRNYDYTRSMAPSAYLDALKMLARRDLSEAQVRQRLLRRGHESEAVDAAVEKLRAEHAIDDARVADAIARTETAVRGRGRLRVQRQIENAGIPGVEARRAVARAFETIDADALLNAALRKRLRSRQHIVDEAEFGRLYRYLIGQGFESDSIMKALKARRGGGSG